MKKLKLERLQVSSFKTLVEKDLGNVQGGIQANFADISNTYPHGGECSYNRC